jgi:chloride channel 3/4/5
MGRIRRWSGLDSGHTGWYVKCGLMSRSKVLKMKGMAIGLNAAFLNIVTEWLSDIKLGYCTTAFYLNENFCCWGAESGKTDAP